MAGATTDKFTDTFNTANPNVARVTAGRTSGAASLTCDNLAGWPTSATSKVHFSTYQINTSNTVIAGTQIDWQGLVSGNTIGSMTRLAGATDNGNSIGDVVEMNATGNWGHDLYAGLTADHDAKGNHKDLHGTNSKTVLGITDGASTVNNLRATSANTGSNPIISAEGTDTNVGVTIASKGTGASKFTGVYDAWVSGLPTPNTVTYNGNRSYTCVFNSVDLSGYLSKGMRLLLTRTVAAPTQCTSLNGTTQYYSKASPSAMTFTNNFVVSAWVKLTSYTAGIIASRYNGTSGWSFNVNGSGQLELTGWNAGAANFADSVSYQSIPLNKWVHVAAQLDMTTTSTGTTNNYMMIDGVEVPNTLTRGGTNPTALVQAGNLEIGGRNGGTNPWVGKIAQVAIYNAKVTQATILASMNQTLSGSETSLISAYSFNNSINDLSANANNLTANGAAVATNADSPFAQAATAGSLEYGIVTAVSFSTNTTVTVQVPEGCAIPTSGGVSAVSYSTQKVPYGFPAQRWKWQIQTIGKTTTTKSSPTANTWYNDCGFLNMNIPIGSWNITVQNSFGGYKAAATSMDAQSTFSTANNTESDSEFTTWINNEGASATFGTRSTTHRSKSLDLSAATVYYLNHRTTTASAFEIAIYGTFALNIITAENAYL